MDENISGCSSNGHEDGAGTGWAKERWTSVWVKALLLGVGDAMWPDVEAHKNTPEIQRMGRKSLDRRTGKLGGEAQGTRDLYLCHNFPKDGTSLHPSLKEWGDTDSP